MRKKIIATIMLMMALGLGMVGSVKADTVEEVKLDSVNFPDDSFRGTASYYDVDKNGHLSADEISKITSVYYDGGDNKLDRKVTSLKGIEYFTNLNSLHLYQTQITSIDLSKNKNLINVEILNPSTQELILPNDSRIKELELHNYESNQLDLKMLTELKKLRLSNCVNIEVLDVTANQKIKSINVSASVDSEDKLRTINIGDKDKLKYLLCSNLSDLKKIKVGETPVMDGVYITDCKKLKKVDTTTMPKLRKLNVEGCGLKSLDVTKNTKLKTLVCSNNKLTKLNVRKNKELKTLKCNGNKIKLLNLKNSKKLRNLNCRKNKIKMLNICNLKLKNIKCDKNVRISK